MMTPLAERAFSTGYLKLFSQFFQDQGVCIDSVVKELNIPQEQLGDFRSFIDFSQCQNLLDALQPLLATPGKGLEFGKRLHLASHGVLGNVSMSARNSLESLQAFQRYLRVRTQLVEFDVVIEDNSAVILMDFNDRIDDEYHFLRDAAMSGAFNVIRSKYGISAPFTRVEFDYDAPSDFKQYESFFDAPIKFSAGRNAYVLSLDLFHQSSDSFNADVFAVSTQQCEKELQILEDTVDLVQKVRSDLLHTTGQLPRQEIIAEQLSMTTRTLRRQLNKLGTSYQELLDEVRKQRAIEYLDDQQQSIADIAFLLGYSDEASFRKAFKRWTGCSPRNYRLAPTD